jgi:hypothetical protein
VRVYIIMLCAAVEIIPLVKTLGETNYMFAPDADAGIIEPVD